MISEHDDCQKWTGLKKENNRVRDKENTGPSDDGAFKLRPSNEREPATRDQPAEGYPIEGTTWAKALRWAGVPCSRTTYKAIVI